MRKPIGRRKRTDVPDFLRILEEPPVPLFEPPLPLEAPDPPDPSDVESSSEASASIEMSSSIAAPSDSVLPPPAEQAGLRAVTVLEQIGTPSARALLKELAKGAEAADLTRSAHATLQRLERLDKSR